MRKVAAKIGRIRPKGGGELHLLPDAKARDSQSIAEALADDTESLLDTFSGNIGGYVTLAWDWDGGHIVHFSCVAPYPRMNDLPRWLEEAMRRAIFKRDMRQLLDEMYGD